MTANSPAPLNEASIRAVLTEEFGAARTLPGEAYLSETVLQWERGHVFEAAWVCVGRRDLVEGNGAQRGIQVGADSVVLTRDSSGALRGFHNSCRHRGHELVPVGECRVKRTITCPYHAWSYGLDGTLRSATRFSEVPGFSTADFPLVPVQVSEWGGWIWVNASADAAPLSEWLGNLDDHIGDWEPDRLVVAASHEYVVQSKWKLIVENYLECYHCPSIHPELCAVSPPESAKPFDHRGIWIGGPMELREHAETTSLDGRSGGMRLRGLTDEQARTVSYYAVLPNLLISTHPDYVMTHRLEALSPTQTHVECAWLFPPESLARTGFDPAYAEAFWDVTNKQDFAACEAVQRGLTTRGYQPGPFDYRESSVYAFQASMATLYSTGQFERPRLIDRSTLMTG